MRDAATRGQPRRPRALSRRPDRRARGRRLRPRAHDAASSGFFGASSMERLPTEIAMTENMRRFKAIPVRRRRPTSGPPRNRIVGAGSHPARLRERWRMSRFVMASDVRQEHFDWGDVGWRCIPPITGSKQLAVIDVALEPGFGHDFHKHPDQEEMIIVHRRPRSSSGSSGPARARAGRLGLHRPERRPRLVQRSEARPRASRWCSARPSATAATSSSTSRARSPGAPCAADARRRHPRVRRPLRPPGG